MNDSLEPSLPPDQTIPLSVELWCEINPKEGLWITGKVYRPVDLTRDTSWSADTSEPTSLLAVDAMAIEELLSEPTPE